MGLHVLGFISLPPAHHHLPLPVQGQPRAWLLPQTLDLMDEGSWLSLGARGGLEELAWVPTGCLTLWHSLASLSSVGQGYVLTAGISFLFSTLASNGCWMST